MSKHIVTFEPSGLRISVKEENTFLDAVRMVGLHLPSECGGGGTCGKCSLILQPAPKPTPIDEEHLKSEEIKKGVRLACQHKVSIDTRALIHQKQGEVKILTRGVASYDDWMLDSGYENQFGIAIDLGTTTIVAYLLSLDSGVQLSQIAALNPQVVYGEDVMSRISHAVREQDGLFELQSRAVSEIRKMIDSLVISAGFEMDAMSRVAIVGNTAMHHLLLGADVSTLGVMPYKPSIKDAVVTSGLELGLQSVPKTEVYLPPNIAGFVGGDTVGFIISQRLDITDDIVLGIDVGTNGEIVLSNHGDLSCCSTAAGPAFEGATIRYGMRGQEGAIEHVVIEDIDAQPEISIIGNVPPQGICGSAIVDTVAELRKSGFLDESGRMQTISSRVYQDDDFGLSYLLVEESITSRKISFNQKDVRQVQLAKGAISAGIKILLEEAKIKIKEIDTVMLAGAFGSYIRPESALSIGLLPSVKRDRIVQVGNAAGEGAKALLLSSKAREIAKDFVSRTNYIELASHDNFQTIFLDSLSIP